MVVGTSSRMSLEINNATSGACKRNMFRKLKFGESWRVLISPVVRWKDLFQKVKSRYLYLSLA